MRLHHLALALTLFVPSCSLAGGSARPLVERPTPGSNVRRALTPAPVRKCAERRTVGQAPDRANRERSRIEPGGAERGGPERVSGD
jgi:hypothetical protein